MLTFVPLSVTNDDVPRASDVTFAVIPDVDVG
jgi:hypothetical protein